VFRPCAAETEDKRRETYRTDFLFLITSRRGRGEKKKRGTVFVVQRTAALLLPRAGLNEGNDKPTLPSLKEDGEKRGSGQGKLTSRFVPPRGGSRHFNTANYEEKKRKRFWLGVKVARAARPGPYGKMRSTATEGKGGKRGDGVESAGKRNTVSLIATCNKKKKGFFHFRSRRERRHSWRR